MVRPLLPVALISLVLGVLLVAGCGGAQTNNAVALPALHDLAPVAAATSRADSARFEMEFTMEMPGFGSPFAFSADGAYDTPGRRAEMTLDLGSFAELMGGLAGAFGDEAPSGLGDASKWKLELRLDGTVAYMRLPFLESELPAGKEWVRVDLAKAAQLGGMDLADIQSFAQGSDPRELLDYLRSISGELTNLGTEDVRGVTTTHYFAAVDWQKALARAARDAGQEGFLSQLQNMPAAVVSVPVDVWVDADNLVRRMTMGFSFGTAGEPEQAQASIEMELFDYGQPVVVEAPPGADVVDAFALKR